MPDDSFAAKVIVVTGASSGVGKGAALAFAETGASVVLAARRVEQLDDLSGECEALGARTLAVPTDVSLESDVEQLAETALAEFGRIDVWVNNAGVSAVGRFEDVPLADHAQVIGTNLLGSLYGSYFAMRQFRQQHFGVLINIASILGRVPAPYYASYVAAKHGIVGLSASLRQELEQNGLKDIHVCTVFPTSVDTPFFEHAANYTGHETTPMPPVYDPQEVIDVIVRLASRPEAEVTVGTAGKLMAAAHQVAPALAESVMSRQMHRAQITQAVPTTDTAGAVSAPSQSGTEVTGGWRRKPPR